MDTNMEGIRMTEEQFVDLYDFLGIPPVSSPNLIYLSMRKIELHDFGKDFEKEKVEEVNRYLALARERLLINTPTREAYEKEWGSYYFPQDNSQTDLRMFFERHTESRLLLGRYRNRTSPWQKLEPSLDTFDYGKDFIYFMMRDLSSERDIFFLNPSQDIQLSPLQDTIFFENDQFYLKSHGKIQVEVINDALGKTIKTKEKTAQIPLQIGDRIEFANGARLILRSIYSNQRLSDEIESAKEASPFLYFKREQVFLSLDPKKVYILGRNTSDIHRLSLDEELFCFVNIGRRERSISRQNLQIFCHQGVWFVQDLGSRYGTTLDIDEHFRFETLVGGGIMPLEKGKIRLGYDKSYIIMVGEKEPPLEKAKERELKPREIEFENGTTIYDIPLM